jgi:hypothetical protein
VIGETRATKIFVNNLMTQPGETDGYNARKHLETIKKYAPEIHFDFVVVNNRRISASRRNATPPRALIRSASTIRLTMRSIKRRRSCAQTCCTTAKRSGTTRIVSHKLCSTAESKHSPQSRLNLPRMSWLTTHRQKPLNVLIMAAGLGTRMKSNRAKVLHELGGRR